MTEALLSAKRRNERVVHLRSYYKQQLTKYLKALWVDGYAVGQEPPKSAQDEYQAILPRILMLVGTAADESLPEGARIRAQAELRRFLELRENHERSTT